ncbi:MAG: glycosyltransferase family 4 protein [Phycisphaerae bacterium]|nr:glycosyltransferase family 4 protein [Phycisphaerae bacterium]
MRIAFLVVKNIARGGGIEKYTQELGSRLVSRGHDVTVYSMRHYGQVPAEFQGMRIVGVRSVRKAAAEKLSTSATAALKVLTGSRYDIVHFHSVAAGAFAWMARVRREKCVLQMHGLEWKRSRWGKGGAMVLRLLEGLCLRQSHAYTAVSRTQCDHFAQRGIEMAYIPTGTELKEPMPPQEILKLGLEPGRYVLFASRLVAEKGAHYLIPAFRRLGVDHKLVIAGDVPGADRYKAELLKLADGDPRILFPGFVTGRLLEELFSHAAVYVQPSEVEGLSIALLEAMSYGNCCLVSDIPENVEAIDAAGWTFGNKEINSLAERLAWLLRNPTEARKTSEQARQRIRDHYSWDHITDQFETLYKGVLSR